MPAAGAPSAAPAEAPGGVLPGRTGRPGGRTARRATTSRSSTRARSSSWSTTSRPRSPRRRRPSSPPAATSAASQEANDGDRSVATITYRIPATRWDDAISDLRGLATKVVVRADEATEVGGQIVDLEARIRNLRASEASLQEIAKGTGKVSDLLEVEAQLTQVRGQIEQLEGQRAQLEDQVAYGTLVTTFGLEVVQVQQQAQGWDPKTDVDGAFATLIAAGQTIVSRPDLVRHRVAARASPSCSRSSSSAAGSSGGTRRARAAVRGRARSRAGARVPGGADRRRGAPVGPAGLSARPAPSPRGRPVRAPG